MTVSLRKRLIGSLMLFTLFAWVMSAVLTGFFASRCCSIRLIGSWNNTPGW